MRPEVKAGSDSLDEAEWDAYVEGHPRATGYHLIAWRRVIERVFGHQTVYLTARDEGGHIHGVLPLVFFSSRLFGRFLVSLPFVNYGGLLADDARFREALLEQAIEQAKKLGADHVELRHQDLSDLRWAQKQHKVSMRLDLPGDFDSLWKTFPAKLRNQIHRAEKEGMVFRLGGEDVLEDFYAVFSRNMRDLGTPVYGSEFFAEILRAFPVKSRIGVVYLNGLPVAAGFLYGFRQALEIPWASSDRRYNRLSPNMLLYRSVLEYACREGFRVFDFGRSSPNSGTYRFKEQWGARPVQLNWHYWLSNGGPLPDLSPANVKFKLAISLWQRLPLFVSERLGPAVVRYIP
jgi:FemAB-related protein (PEP-CTERM system-associated)